MVMALMRSSGIDVTGEVLDFISYDRHCIEANVGKEKNGKGGEQATGTKFKRSEVG